MTDKNTGKITNESLTSTTMAKTEDGTIQITITIPNQQILKEKDVVIKEHAKQITIEGFRKGNAPLDKVEEKIDKNHLTQDILSGVLNQVIPDIYKKYKIQPAIYPKLELISADEDKPWQVRMTTCEIPNIDLGKYEDKIKDEAESKIVVPGKENKISTSAEKEQKVFQILLKIVKAKIPDIMVEQDVNTRLSQLLEQVQKLGLTLDKYLASIGKTAENLREDYLKQAKDSIILELSLNKIADEYGITVNEKEYTEALTSLGGEKNNISQLPQEQQKGIITSILRRKKALEKLTSMI